MTAKETICAFQGAHPGDGFSVRVNIGCGATPTDGWVNLDNSFVVRVARWSLLAKILLGTRIVRGPSCEFVKVVNREKIGFANASVRIPRADSSVDVLYSSHMIEHLDRREAKAFLLEARRVLRPGGMIRLAAPDLARLVEEYLVTGDADRFVSSTYMGQERPSGIFSRLKLAWIGPRHHLWMYDGRSLVSLLSRIGFTDVCILPPGMTNIADPGGLDLAERADESVYVEAIQPIG